MGRRSSPGAALLVLVALLLVTAAPVHATAAEEGKGVVIYGVDYSGDASRFTIVVYVNGSSACTVEFGAKQLDVYRFTSYRLSGGGCAVVEYLYGGEKLYALLVRGANANDIDLGVAKDVQWYQILIAGLTLLLVQPYDYLDSSLVLMTSFRDFVYTYATIQVVEQGKVAYVASFLEALVAPLRTVADMILSGLNAFTIGAGAIADGFKTLLAFIGKPGDVNAMLYAGLYRLQLQPYADSEIVGGDVRAVLDCEKPIGEVRGLLKEYREQDLSKTICDVEESAPQGIVGMFSVLFTLTLEALKLVPQIAKYFVLINAIVFAFIMARGAEKTFRTGNPEHMAESIKSIYRILKFYFNCIAFVVKLIIGGVQAAAQSSQVIITLADKTKSALEKLIDIFKTILLR